MYRLYAIPGSCSTGIHVLLNRLGQDVDIIDRASVPDYAQLVPTNQVPALVAGDELLTEGAAIVFHLLETHGGLPTAPEELRQFRQWLLFDYATIHATYSKLFMAGTTDVVTHAESRTALIDHIAERISTLWAIVEARLDGRSWIVGDAPTVIDYLMAIYVNWGNAVPQARIEIGPRTRDLVTRVVALPEFQQALKREGIEHRLPA